MRRKSYKTVVKPKVDDTWKHEICDHCAFSVWNDWTEWNFDLNGKPITLRCPNYKEGKYGIIRGTPACRLFKSGDKKEE